MLAALVPAAIAGTNYVPIRIAVLSEPAIVVTEGTLHPRPPRYRVTHAQTGAPMPGLRFFVSIGVVHCFGPDCEDTDFTRFATFEGADPAEPRDLVRIADADGIVTGLPVRAGRGLNFYPIFISPHDGESPPWMQVVGGEPQIPIHQLVAAAPQAIPSAGPGLLGGLALALALLAARRFR